MEQTKILVVDDEARMRKLVKDFLTIKGYQVIEAGDGEEAVEIFFHRFLLSSNHKLESCSQDSPPVAERFSDTLPLRRSAIPRSVFLCHRAKFPTT